MKTLNIIAVCLVTLMVLGCTQSIDKVKNEDYIGKKVTVKGTVHNTMKIGELSGYQLQSEDGSIAVASQELPSEGSTKTITGIIRKSLLLGYYLETS